MNKVTFIGSVTSKPEIQTTNSGKSVSRFSIAVKRDFKNANGEYDTDFFTIETWGGLAENCCKHLKKGSKVGVSGSIHNNSFTGKDGQPRKSTVVRAESVEFLSAPNGTNKSENKSTNTPPELDEIDAEGLPF